MLTVRLFTKLAALWNHSTSARFTLIRSYFSNSTSNDLLREWLRLIIASNIIQLIIIFILIFFLLICLISNISYLNIIFLTCLMDLFEYFPILQNILNIQYLSTNNLDTVILNLRAQVLHNSNASFDSSHQTRLIISINLIIIIKVEIRNLQPRSLCASKILHIPQILPQVCGTTSILQGQWVLLGDLLNLCIFDTTSEVMYLLL